MRIHHRRNHNRVTSNYRNNKIHKVMNEFKHHTLHSGSKHGPIVRNRKQAIAIALSEARRRR